ncbi:MAG: hypothetical protein ACPGVA_17645 [Pikeienuella sp.]
MIRTLAVALAAASACAFPSFAAEQDINIAGTTFYGATAFTRQVGGGPVRKGYLFFYKSDLGEALRLRPVAQDELDEMRRVCFFMQKTVEESATGQVDDYFLEFGAGDGDPTSIPADKRFVFVFTNERGCAADPTPTSLN